MLPKPLVIIFWIQAGTLFLWLDYNCSSNYDHLKEDQQELIQYFILGEESNGLKDLGWVL